MFVFGELRRYCLAITGSRYLFCLCDLFLLLLLFNDYKRSLALSVRLSSEALGAYFTHVVTDPPLSSNAIRTPQSGNPGFDFPRQRWSLLNRFRMEQGHCSACRRKWRLTDTDLCPSGKTQTISHIVESCPMTKLNGGLSRLHSADEDAVSWLTNYGSWHAYEKKKNDCQRSLAPFMTFSIDLCCHCPTIVHCYDTVGWVIWRLKVSLKWPIIYQVRSDMLFAHSI